MMLERILTPGDPARLRAVTPGVLEELAWAGDTGSLWVVACLGCESWGLYFVRNICVICAYFVVELCVDWGWYGVYSEMGGDAACRVA
jgi:hypothetical protein